jgi:hypothetical protein
LIDKQTIRDMPVDLRLQYWMTEREIIRKLRWTGQKDNLTEDPVLKQFRFCNVRREHDRVTMQVAQALRTRQITRDNEAYLTTLMTAARLFNREGAIDWIAMCAAAYESPHDGFLSSLKQGMKELRDVQGKKIFGAAYIVSTAGRRMDKVDYVFEVLAKVSELKLETNTLQYAHNRLCSIHGLGSFLGAQVVADLKNTVWSRFASAPDWWVWCAPGPGSLRGLARLMGGHRPALKHFLGHAQARLAHQRDIGTLKTVGELCMQDFQNCLCEFDKYERALWNEGKPKQRYSPSKAPLPGRSD